MLMNLCVSPKAMHHAMLELENSFQDYEWFEKALRSIAKFFLAGID